MIGDKSMDETEKCSKGIIEERGEVRWWNEKNTGRKMRGTGAENDVKETIQWKMEYNERKI